MSDRKSVTHPSPAAPRRQRYYVPGKIKETKHSTGSRIPPSCLGLNDINTLDTFIDHIRDGLDVVVVEHLAQALGLPPQALIVHLHINARTYARRRKCGRLRPVESDRVVRLAVVFEEAVQLFEGDRVQTACWFKTKNRALGGKTPLGYMDTEPGTQLVQDLIGRLGHGVFS